MNTNDLLSTLHLPSSSSWPRIHDALRARLSSQGRVLPLTHSELLYLLRQGTPICAESLETDDKMTFTYDAEDDTIYNNFGEADDPDLSDFIEAIFSTQTFAFFIFRENGWEMVVHR